MQLAMAADYPYTSATNHRSTICGTTKLLLVVIRLCLCSSQIPMFALNRPSWPSQALENPHIAPKILSEFPPSSWHPAELTIRR